MTAELSALVHTFLADRCPSPTAREATVRFPAELWRKLEDLGIPLISVPEEAGGSGGDVEDACAVLRAVGSHAAPVPVAETGLLGGWLLATAGLEVPGGPITVGPVRWTETLHLDRTGGRWRARGRLTGIPWGRDAETLVVVASESHSADEHVLVLTQGSWTTTHGANLAGEHRDTVEIAVDDSTAGAQRARVPAGTRAAMQVRGALSRVSLISGALDTVRELTMTFAKDRVQFGRPISTFPAVQTHLVRLVQHQLATRLGALAASRDFDSVTTVAAAAIATAASARQVARHAHQVHGAIGVTEEYDLQLFTRRTLAWAQEFGSQRYWSRFLGDRMLAADNRPSAVWDVVTGPGQ